MGDTTIEADETFNVTLSAPTNATLSNSSSAVVTIKNDDIAPVVPSIAMTAVQTVTEGNSGTSNAAVTVTLSAATTQAVTVNYTTTDGTATNGTDYSATIGTLIFAAGETSKTITVPVLGDTTVETDETLNVKLTAPTNATLSSASSAVVTIKNDDIAPVVPSIEITAAQTVTEGNSGTGNAAVTVTLSAATTQAVTVNYATTDGTAQNGSDYTAATGVLTFAAGETSKTVTIPVLGDATIETDETFSVALSLPINSTLGAVNSAVVTIKNDDTPKIVVFDGLDLSMSDTANSFTGTSLNDRILALGANDTVDGAAGNDYLDGGDGDDKLTGSDGNDSLYGGLGDDNLDGTTGESTDLEKTADLLDGGDGNDRLSGRDNDTLIGGDGNDHIYQSSSNSSVDIALDGGNGDDYISVDFYDKGTITGGDGDDQINVEHYNSYDNNGNSYSFVAVVEGGNGNDTLDGYGDNCSIDGGVGNDTLYGSGSDNTLIGGGGDDSISGGSYYSEKIIGGLGIDTLTGNGGDDVFIFAAGDSGVGIDKRDIITDFAVTSSVEVIDLSSVSSGVLGYIGSAAFNAANQVRYSFDFTNNITVVQINLDSDTATADMEIQITGLLGLTAPDFVL